MSDERKAVSSGAGVLLQISRSNGGLPKFVVDGPVLVGHEGISGDRQRNRRVHGGPNKAVLMVAAEALEELTRAGFALAPGSLGENLTVQGFDRRNWRTGQQYKIGNDVLIQLTTLRSPCLNLDVYGPEIKGQVYDRRCQAGDPSSPVWALAGFYARVIRPGEICAGDSITLS